MLKRVFAGLLAAALLLFSGCGGASRPPDDNCRTYYEVFVYSFYDTDGDGVGDLKGLTQKLDYISDMGFNGIWLMPVHPSPTYHKYDVKDYYSIDPQYGTMEDFDALMAACEDRGIRVIMDLVLNHTSSQHPWFLQAVEALKTGAESPYTGYYHFTKEKLGGEYYPAAGGWYYEGKFWDGMPDLNLSSEELRAEIAKIMQFWMEKGVGGFRLDAVKEFYSGETAKNIEVLSWLARTIKEIDPEGYLVGEDWDTTTGLYDYYDSGIDSLFNFPFAAQSGRTAQTLLDSRQTAQKYGQALLEAQTAIAAHNPSGIDAPFFTNHDSPRAAGFLRSDPALIKTAWGMNLMQSGNAFVYYGEELGMSGSGKDENKRAPMAWTADIRAPGMTYGPPGMEAQENRFPPADEQQKDPGSIMSYVKKAVSIRNKYPEIARGTLELLETGGDEDVCGVRKTWNGGSVYLVYNLSKEKQTATLSPEQAGGAKLADWLSADGSAPEWNGGRLELPPYSIAILR